MCRRPYSRRGQQLLFGFIYGRPDNGTTREAESVLAMLEMRRAWRFGRHGGNRRVPGRSPRDHRCIQGDGRRAPGRRPRTRRGLTIYSSRIDELLALESRQAGANKLFWASNCCRSATITEYRRRCRYRAEGRRDAIDLSAHRRFTRAPTLGADIVNHAATRC